MSVQEVVKRLRSGFLSGKTRPYEWRVQQLHALEAMVWDNEDAMKAALRADLGRHPSESMYAEFTVLYAEIAHTLENLKEWMKPRKHSSMQAMFTIMDTVEIRPDPLGVILVIAPWNYPLQLLLAPLASVFAAGNCALLKPSEVSTTCERLISQLIPQYFDADVVSVICGGVQETTEILAEKFDHIIFTGSTMVGKIVMAAAAKHLTPVTLELGGKSPVIITRNTDMRNTAKRMTWGKFMNAGQTCIAPDYALVMEDVYESFLTEMQRAITEVYSDNPESAPSFARIISEGQYNRLNRSMDAAKEANIVCHGGQCNAKTKYIAPTLLRDVTGDSPFMDGEIFGPVLPVMKISSLDEAIDFINARPKPLALYIFSTRSKDVNRILNSTTSGQALVNDVMLQVAVPSLPFGGVGDSGMAAYHGTKGFETFSHMKSVLKRRNGFEFLNMFRYAPYTNRKDPWMLFLLGYPGYRPTVKWGIFVIFWMLATGGALAGIGVTDGDMFPSKAFIAVAVVMGVLLLVFCFNWFWLCTPCGCCCPRTHSSLYRWRARRPKMHEEDVEALIRTGSSSSSSTKSASATVSVSQESGSSNV